MFGQDNVVVEDQPNQIRGDKVLSHKVPLRAMLKIELDGATAELYERIKAPLN